MKRVAIVDYGLGNLLSLQRALLEIGTQPILVNTPDEIKKSEILILPGVGAFKAGMKGLKERKLTRAIKYYCRKGKPLLGICLGMQLLFSKGYEFGACEGLNLIKGKVVKFPELKDKWAKVPHIGWNSLIPVKQQERSFLPKTKNNLIVYFVHSYICLPEDKRTILAKTEYGGYQFPSIVGWGDIFGCQFHPEKSGKRGLLILKNFVSFIFAPR